MRIPPVSSRPKPLVLGQSTEETLLAKEQKKKTDAKQKPWLHMAA